MDVTLAGFKVAVHPVSTRARPVAAMPGRGERSRGP
jgi:hypothetical protein